MNSGRRLEPGGKILRGRVGRSDPRCEESREEKQDSCYKSNARNDTLAEKLAKRGE
jgi:hypothetical protein